MITEDPDSKKKAVRVAQSPLSNTTNEWIDNIFDMYPQSLKKFKDKSPTAYNDFKIIFQSHLTHLTSNKKEMAEQVSKLMKHPSHKVYIFTPDELQDFRNTVIDECIAALPEKRTMKAANLSGSDAGWGMTYSRNETIDFATENLAKLKHDN